MTRVYNFNAGPSALPEEVLREAADEMFSYKNSGMSVMEMSHRSSDYQAIIDDAENTLRDILGLDKSWDVLFLQGGATLEFAAVPLNLMKTGHAGYVVSGNFSKKAWQEAQKYGQADAIASSQETNFDRIPDIPTLDQSLDYLHICQNNTIFGTMYQELPECGKVPLVADVSSCFLSLPFDMSRYSVIYAGAQKNAGPAGTAVVCVRHELIEDGPATSICPSYINWKEQAKAGSMYNTPNCWGIYMCGKVFNWVKQSGGLSEMEKRNRQKIAPLYEYLDQSTLFHPTALPKDRSIANVTFKTDSADIDSAFISFAKDRKIVGIKGHRLVGGMRASCYNAVPGKAIDALVECMSDFETSYKKKNA